MATSEIDIANMALNLINEPEIQTIENPKEKAEKIVKRFLNEVIEEICSLNEWNFCTRVVKFAEDVGTDVDYAHRFAIPNIPKTLRIIEKVDDPYSQWERRGEFVVTDSEEFIGKVLYKPEHVKFIPAYMTRCIVTLLAGRIAVPLLGIDGAKLADYYENMYIRELRPNAMAVDANEGHMQHKEYSATLDSEIIDGVMACGSRNDLFTGEIEFDG